jgi:hypothetical protein
LEQFLSQVRKDPEILQGGEEIICMGVVLPVLARLGWDRDNIREVTPQFRVGNGRVDYCLRAGQKKAVFVEVKQASEKLEQHDEQLLKYAFQDGVELAVLTNGLLWWLYLPLLKGSWEERRFFAVDLRQQETADAAARLEEFLGRGAVADGSAVERAEALQASKEKERRIEETLPRAWQELCEKPDELLIELVADKVESLCGHRPDVQRVSGFLGRIRAAHQVLPPAVPLRGRPRALAAVAANGASAKIPWTHRKPSAYVLRGHRRSVQHFSQVLLGLCADLCKAHKDGIQRLLALNLPGRRPYFSKDGEGMNEAVKVPGTAIYAELWLGAEGIRRRCAEVLHGFGYSEDDFQVELRDT